ncbi:MAG TPA: hypothetical protein PLO37_14850 [Candidatus Hydrogenedentes bacterium]|nr:hypothetical protein [Candidatus Hydrogenedentota bacterium]HPG68125.1 hypothetical protein [Candidatus Hydrogenedentota bacterium]
MRRLKNDSPVNRNWIRWGAILQVMEEHGDGMLIECLLRRVKSLTGECVRREQLEEDFRFLLPMIARRDDKVYLSGRTSGTYYAARKATSYEGKLAVAMHVHNNLLSKLDSVFLDAGSACEAIAWEMAQGDKGHFTVITNNMAAINAFVTNPSIRLHLTGGCYIKDDESLIGERAERTLQGFFVRYAIVGLSGITAHHIYCHGIEGEENLKKTIWAAPAGTLIVPATLDKFSGMDACCFGELFREGDGESGSSGSFSDPESLDDGACARVEEVRQEEHERLVQEQLWKKASVPRFRANRCIIVIEPEWMIDSLYKEQENRREELMAVVTAINGNRIKSKVTVVHADVSPQQLSKRRLCPERAAAKRTKGQP